MIGRSHGIHAEPVTFGLKLGVMYDEFTRAVDRLKQTRERVAYGMLSGAVGTNAHLDPKVEAFVCERLGLKPATISTQIIQRDRHADFMTTLALIGCSIDCWATEFRHLQRTEVLEVEEAFAKGLPILQGMGKNIFHAGGPGAGQAVKICNNMMLAINMIGVAEGFILAEKLGLDWMKLHAICTTATSNSFALSNYCPAPGPTPASPANRDYAPGFMTALMLKDVKLSQAAAEATGVATPMAALAASLYQATVDAGGATKDFSVVFRLLENMKRG
jgi:hypothetical protein